MKLLRTILKKSIAAGAMLGVGGFPAMVWACPTCKDGLSENYVSAYAYSIMFMMSVPYILLAGFFAYIVVAYFRKPAAQRKELSADQLAEIALKKAEQGIPTQPPAWD